MSWPLRAFCLAVLALLGWGLLQRGQPADFGGALSELLDGDADRDERCALLRQVRDRGAELGEAGDHRAGLVAAMAALELGDDGRVRGAFQAVAPGLPEAGEQLDAASLGEPYLRSLLEAYLAEQRGALEEARRLLERARLSARLFGAEHAEALAARDLKRLQ